jgi:RND family efflux transporter MFP subunit
VEERVVTPRISLVGSAEPWLETVVASEASGKVKDMLIHEGERVKENQLLCEQDTSQLELRIQAAQARLKESQANRAKAEREWERQKQLYEINSVAAKAYDDARFNLDAARSNESRLKADLMALKDQLNKKRIKAPVAGYVVKRYCIVGQWLGEGEPVATLVVEDPIWVRIPVPERYISGIKPGQRAEVTFDALPGRTFKGEVVAVIPRAEEAARTFPVRIQVPNPEGKIKAGMLGRATFFMGEAERILLVHKDSLVLSEQGTMVYVIDGQSVRPVRVVTGSAQDSMIEVRGKLSPGQLVVTRGNERLRPGQPVRIISR